MAFAKNRATNAIPRPCPAGGVMHIIPTPGPDVKKIAKAITVISYLKDGRGQTVFVQEKGRRRPIPQTEIDPDAVVREALKRCPRMDDMSYTIVSAEGEIIGEELILDPEAAAAGLPLGTLLGRGLREEFLSTLIDVPIPPAETPDGAAPVATVSEPEDVVVACSSEEIVMPDDAVEGDEDATEAEPKVRSMLLAEWILQESIELGEAKTKEARKNS